MKTSVFQYQSYQEYLRDFFDQTGENRPKRAYLAKRLNCQSSFISQVFNNKTDLSLEHAIIVADFLELDADECRYFVLLVQLSRAGSQHLKAFFTRELKVAKQKVELIKSNIQVKDELTEEDQAIYYSQWWYSAIHILVAFPEVQNIDDLKKCLKLPKKIIQEALQFLLERQLVVSVKGSLQIGKTRIHLGSRSPQITRHHMNWREKSFDILAARNPENLHYTGVIGISRDGADKVRAQILTLLKGTEEIVEKTKEEAAYVLLLDFFELGPK